MNATDARVRHFALLGAILLLPFLLLYSFLLPGYRAMVLGASGALLRTISPAMRLELQADGTWLVSVPAFRGRTAWAFLLDSQEFGQEVAFLGLAILPALVLATPVSLARRFRLLLVALGTLFAVNVMSVAILVLVISVRCYGREADRTCSLIAGSLSTWSHVTTFGLWGLLTWRYWFGGPNGRG